MSHRDSHDLGMAIEPVPADSMSSPADASRRSHTGSGDAGALTTALIVGVLIGLSVGMRIGNAARKRMDRWKPCY